MVAPRPRMWLLYLFLKGHKSVPLYAGGTAPALPKRQSKPEFSAADDELSFYATTSRLAPRLGRAARRVSFRARYARVSAGPGLSRRGRCRDSHPDGL